MMIKCLKEINVILLHELSVLSKNISQRSYSNLSLI